MYLVAYVGIIYSLGASKNLCHGGGKGHGVVKWASCQDGGQCDFHPLVVYSCGNCLSTDKLQCAGKEYASKNVLRCDLHSLTYEIECDHRAEPTAEVIDPEFGRSHSNPCESNFSVLTKYCPKHTNLHRLHYQVSTNIGLIQSSMTYLFGRRRSSYHWAIELYERMGLPQLKGMREIVRVTKII